MNDEQTKPLAAKLYIRQQFYSAKKYFLRR